MRPIKVGDKVRHVSSNKISTVKNIDSSSGNTWCRVVYPNERYEGLDLIQNYTLVEKENEVPEDLKKILERRVEDLRKILKSAEEDLHKFEEEKEKSKPFYKLQTRASKFGLKNFRFSRTHFMYEEGYNIIQLERSSPAMNLIARIIDYYEKNH